MTGTHLRVRWPAVMAMVAVAVVFGGCNRPSRPPRYPVSGRVTVGGKPLVLGRISFEPQTERGNQGPGAYGEISAGRYETYGTMGAVGGPHRVVIEGYAGDTHEQRQKRTPLFPPYVSLVDLPVAAASFDFDVPAQAVP